MTHIIIKGADPVSLLAEGQRLAVVHNCPLYHLQAIIESGETIPIATIIQDEGLDAFHHIASVYLESVLRRETGIITVPQDVCEHAECWALLAGYQVITPLQSPPALD